MVTIVQITFTGGEWRRLPRQMDTNAMMSSRIVRVMIQPGQSYMPPT